METISSDEDPMQKAMTEYANTMGVPTEGNSLTDNVGRWGHTLAGYDEKKCEALAKQNGDESTPKGPRTRAQEFSGTHQQ